MFVQSLQYGNVVVFSCHEMQYHCTRFLLDPSVVLLICSFTSRIVCIFLGSYNSCNIDSGFKLTSHLLIFGLSGE